MSKPISSYPESERTQVALRRVKGNTGGIGYLSAVGYLARAGMKVERKEAKHRNEEVE
jgi:hypothetical protein